MSLQRDDGIHAAHDHRPQRIHVVVAEKEPVGPRLVKGAVEPANLRDVVDFTRVVVPALDAEHHAIHHQPQAASGRQFVQRVEA